MEHFKYGTPEYYSELFSDIIADAEHPGAIEAILTGFELSINSWIDYHGSAHKRYRDLMMAFQSITSSFPPAYMTEQGKATLPPTPSVPTTKSGASK